MNVTFIISSLTRGGAEGVLARLANGLSSRGHAVNIVTLNAAAPEYRLDSGVSWFPLGIVDASASTFEAIIKNFHRIRSIRCVILQIDSDVVVSFMEATNVLTLLAVGRSKPVVVSERIHPDRHEAGHAWRWLRKISYPMARLIHVQTETVRSFFPKPLRDKVCVIPNAAVDDFRDFDSLQTRNEFLLVAMGRLEYQKGFDLLLKAFAMLGPHLDHWKLTIYGEGKERASLEALRDDLNLSGRVLLPGRVDDPHTIFTQSALFVLSSRFEGFPNVLVEAMGCGTPVVAFDCLSGPSEIIRHAVDGWLVPAENVAALANGLDVLMSDVAFRQRLGANARHVLDRFSEKAILELWEHCLETAMDAGKE